LFALSFICAMLLIVFTRWPTDVGLFRLQQLPWVFAAFVSLLPITYIFLNQLKPNRKDNLNNDGKIALLTIYAVLNILIAFLMKFTFSLILEQRSTQLSTQTRKRTTVDYDWIPCVGNIATLLGFVLSVSVNILFLGGSQTCIFFLAPLLVLLSQDHLYFTRLTYHNKHFPIIAATSLFLMFASLEHLIFLSNAFVGDTFLALFNPVAPTTSISFLHLIKNLILLVGTLPSHFFFQQIYVEFFKSELFPVDVDYAIRLARRYFLKCAFHPNAWSGWVVWDSAYIVA